MKIRLLIIYLIILLLTACDKRDFNNPVSSEISIQAPTGLKAVQQGEWIKLSWDTQKDVTGGWKVERKTAQSDFEQIADVTDHSQLIYIDTTSTTAVTYQYRLRGYSDENESDWSRPLSFSTQFPAPTSLSATAISDSEIKLTWTDNCAYEAGYRIEKDIGSGFLSIAETGANTTVFSDNTILWNSEQSYRVLAFSSINSSEYSNQVSLNPAQQNAPGEFQLSELLEEIQLSWLDNCSFEEGFCIERSDNGGEWQQVADLTANSTGYTDSNLDYTVTYSYRVYAHVSGKKTSYSNEKSGKPKAFVEMIEVPGGTFTMGDTWGDGSSDETPTHWVTLSSFYMGKYELTQEQYQEVMGNNPSYFSGTNLPVERVDWYDAVTFCNTLSEQEGLTPCYDINGSSTACNFNANGYRLPTEAEWEYACRGGLQSAQHKYAGSDNADDVAWYGDNSGSKTHAVGAKQANELGLYDMSGNVYEWCWDWYGSYSSYAQTNPGGPSDGSYRVLRGGSWNYYASIVRVADRNGYKPSNSIDYYGFRLTRAF